MSANTRGQSHNSDESDSLESQTDAAGRQSARGTVPGVPTWPTAQTDGSEEAVAPVGLHWQYVADALQVDRHVLEHDGLIMVAGEYFPAPGYFIDPSTMRSQRVDVGDIALIHGYFLGQATVRQFNVRLEPAQAASPGYRHIIPSPRKGQMIGLFVDVDDAVRAKDRIVRAALASGVAVERGPLGIEVRVARPQQPGRVAGIIAGHGGGVIAIDGVSVTQSAGTHRVIATGDGGPGRPGDARRAGIGVTGSSAGPEIASAVEAGRGHLREFTQST
ncbi:MAG: hypothetical protein PVSMB7_02960 [Chloroflexota bacterium]